MHTASGCLHPWPLGVMTMSYPVVVFTLEWVLRAAFGLHAHVPLVSLSMSLGFGALALLP
jgi:hypothetical protein